MSQVLPGPAQQLQYLPENIIAACLHNGLALARLQATAQGKWLCPPIWHLWDHIWSAVSTFGSPQHKRHWHTRLEHLLYWRRAEKTGVFILKKRKPRVCIPVYKYPTGMDERGPLLYSDRHSARQQVLAGKWEIHNSVGSRKNIYTWRWSNTGAGVQKAYGISLLEDT